MKKTLQSSRAKQSHLSTALNIASLLLWVSAGIVIGQVFVGVIMCTILGDDLYSGTLWMTVYTALSYTMTCFIVIYVPSKIKKFKTKTTREELGLKGTLMWRDIGLAIAGFAAYLVLAGLLLYVFSLIFSWFDPQEAQEIGFSNLSSVSQRILAFFALVIVAPIAEEVIFRGWLYGKLRKYTNIWISILLVSALFAAAHGTWNVAINVFAMSIVMCLIRELTGTIWGSIFLHFLKNAIAFYLLLYYGAL